MHFMDEDGIVKWNYRDVKKAFDNIICMIDKNTVKKSIVEKGFI